MRTLILTLALFLGLTSATAGTSVKCENYAKYGAFRAFYTEYESYIEIHDSRATLTKESTNEFHYLIELMAYDQYGQGDGQVDFEVIVSPIKNSTKCSVDSVKQLNDLFQSNPCCDNGIVVDSNYCFDSYQEGLKACSLEDDYSHDDE